MISFIKGAIAVIAAVVVMFIADSFYQKRVDQNAKGLRVFIVLQTAILFLMYALAIYIVKMFVPNDPLDHIADKGFGMFGIQFVVQFKHFLFCKRDVTVRKLVPIIGEYKQIHNGESKMLGAGIKDEELNRMKQHIRYILGHVEQEVPSIKEDTLEFEFGKDKKKYYINIEYYFDGGDKGAFESTREEFKQCMKRMQTIYEVMSDSKKDWECAKIMLPV